MSGHSDSTRCPICENEMSRYTDYKPFDNISGECIYCGFSYYTKTKQMSVDEINERREDCNENGGLPKGEELKLLTQKDLDKYAKDIKKIF